ncbi:HAD family phosphatase [Leptolyngbya sp. FACHB-711]|uniref:HAD family hydrolase n=1 Tax=unclassified Leptolyngbya TaxID=2650499 RepID=UPI00168408C6|nr:HAD family phosphatase [Leptolyngbya sp. FACHB-711]MBD1853122.1 HAD family phosphatase [Cyanobacteria bacterium FACHB-502]MBD2025973.1 HAD family phosphatase [Leptolyngbya sp. FACHB-711]
MLKALLFDLDGTMADTDPVHFQNWQSILLSYGITIDRPTYRAKFSGRRNQEIVPEILPQLTIAEGDELGERKEAMFRQQAATVLQPMPGLLEVLRWTEQHQLKRAIVTNAPLENVEFMLGVLHLDSEFPLVVLGDELPRGKPDPMPYLAALDQLGVTASETIAFEDSPSGIRSAVAAGIPTVGIASTHEPQKLYDLGAFLVIDNFTAPDLFPVLEQAMQSSLPA